MDTLCSKKKNFPVWQILVIDNLFFVLSLTYIFFSSFISYSHSLFKPLTDRLTQYTLSTPLQLPIYMCVYGYTCMDDKWFWSKISNLFRFEPFTSSFSFFWGWKARGPNNNEKKKKKGSEEVPIRVFSQKHIFITSSPHPIKMFSH